MLLQMRLKDYFYCLIIFVGAGIFGIIGGYYMSFVFHWLDSIGLLTCWFF